MILYNEKINNSTYPLVFLKTDGGKRIPAIVFTIVENNANNPMHKNGLCDVRAKCLCTLGRRGKDAHNCFFENNSLYLPDGEQLPVTVLLFEPYESHSFVGYATFTCIAHYE